MQGRVRAACVVQVPLQVPRKNRRPTSPRTGAGAGNVCVALNENVLACLTVSQHIALLGRFREGPSSSGDLGALAERGTGAPGA